MSAFPEFMQGIPAIDYGIEGLEVRCDKLASGGTMFFVHAEKDTAFPKHAHGFQYI